MIAKCSCKGCNERYPGCHSKCEKYKSSREEVDKKNSDRLKVQLKNAPFYDAINKTVTRKLRKQKYA